jgi:hypothetical protein
MPPCGVTTTSASGPPTCGLRRDVADDEAVAAAGEAAVGDQRDLLAQPRPMTALVGESISRMPGPALRALVADDDHVALRTRAENRRQRLSSESNTRPAGERSALLAGDLGHRALRARGCRAG